MCPGCGCRCCQQPRLSEEERSWGAGGGGGGAGNTWRNVVEAASPGLPDLVIEGHFHTQSRIMGVGRGGFLPVHTYVQGSHTCTPGLPGTCGT